MNEGYVVNAKPGEIAGIVVRQKGERGYRFHASTRRFEPMDGHIFASPLAAERAARAFDEVPDTEPRGRSRTSPAPSRRN